MSGCEVNTFYLHCQFEFKMFNKACSVCNSWISLVSVFSEIAFGQLGLSFWIVCPPPPTPQFSSFIFKLKREVKWNSIRWLLPWGGWCSFLLSLFSHGMRKSCPCNAVAISVHLGPIWYFVLFIRSKWNDWCLLECENYTGTSVEL